MSLVGNNSSLSSFLASLTEDKEVTMFEIVSDNARPSPERLNDLLFSPEPKEVKCRWKNLVRLDSDDDLMRRKRGGFTGCGRRSGTGRQSPVASSSRPTRPAVTRISSDPNLLRMPRRRLSPERVTGNRNSNDQYSSQGQSDIRKGKAIAASDTNLLRIPQRKPSPRADSGTLLSSSSNHNNANAIWGPKTKQERKNMFLNMMMTPDLSQLESESDVETVGPTADDGEMSNELKGGSNMMPCGAETDSPHISSGSQEAQPKMVTSKASLMNQTFDGLVTNKMMKKKKSFDRMDHGLQSKAKLYGMYQVTQRAIHIK